jgi:hypothetical protein
MASRFGITLLVLSFLFPFFITAQRAEARPYALSKDYQTDKRLGVGVMLGVPASVSLKFLMTDTLALDAAAGAYIAYRDRTGFHAHADLLWHPFVAVEGESFLAPLYFGLGARLLAYEFTHIGVRVPVGISFDFGKKPFDIFLEGAFIYDFSMPAEATGPVDINAVVGVRYYLF